MKNKLIAGAILALNALLFTSCEWLWEQANSTTDAAAAESSDYVRVTSKSSYTVTSVNSGKTAYLIVCNNTDETSFDYNQSGAGVLNNDFSSRILQNDEITLAETNQFSKTKNTSQYREKTLRDLYDFSNSGTLKKSYRALHSEQNINIEITKNSVGDTKSFYTSKENGKTVVFSTVNATCKAVGTYCDVWYVNDTSVVSESDLDFSTVASKFDSIYSIEQKVFGSVSYQNKQVSYSGSSFYQWADSSEKINILIFDIDGDAKTDQDSGTLGYFYGIDMYSTKYMAIANSSQGTSYKTNATKIFYVDSYFLKEWTEDSYSTLAHEFQHMLGFINKTIVNNVYHETWFTEMLSVSCEDVMRTHLGLSVEKSVQGTRLPYFIQCYNYGFTSWSSSTGYPCAFGYISYLARNYGGISLIKEIATNSKVNKASITAALQALGYDETYGTTFFKYAKSLVNTGATGVTMNKSVTETISGTSFTLSAIKLTDYKAKVSSNNASALYNYSDGYIIGPMILKSGYSTGIGPSGITISYLGKVSTGSTINLQTPSSGLEMFIYFK